MGTTSVQPVKRPCSCEQRLYLAGNFREHFGMVTTTIGHSANIRKRIG
jgi:hypothetical protein